MTQEEILAIFFAECEESLEAAENGLAACRDGTQDSDTVNAVFRGVHSIKGGAGAFGFSALQAFTHTFETLLSDVRDGKITLGDPLIQLMLRALDVLSDHVRAAHEGSAAPDDRALLAELTAAQTGGGVHNVAALAPDPVAVANSEPASALSDAEADLGFDLDLDALLDDIAAAVPAAQNPHWTLRLRPHAGAMANGGEPLLLLRELAGLGATCSDCDVSAVPPLDEIDPCQGYLGWTFTVPAGVEESDVTEVFDFVGDDVGLAIGEGGAMPDLRITPRAAPKPAPAPVAAAAPAAAAPALAAAANPAPVAAPSEAAPPAPPSAAQSIRIDLVKLDRLIDTVGELVIAQAMLAQRLGNEGMGTSEELVMLEGLTREIQESAMAIRAQPIGSVFSRVPRILRELASSTGKHVKLEVSGEATELDKTVIERLGEPLTHLIRNAVDHGIEDAEARLAAGKSAEGTLRLSAEHRSGRILIKIADDGKGIDRARVLAKAVEKGLVAPDAQLSKEEIDALIFAPGFSTAQTVSNISGRGVGMDVVRQNVKDLGGRITIESVEGQGTVFTLTLPLTLAISDGMIVTVGDQMLVVPLTHVVESLRPQPGEVQGLGVSCSMLNVRGKFIPIVPVGDVITARGAVDDPARGVLIVVDTESTGQAALLVDNICDQRQFVIKSLDTHYRAVEGVAGATILGDGRVALILDIDGLVARSCQTGAVVAPQREAA
ncbi:chemotaxis protein CheA [Novosphingobium sp.]|uniref:chemotaxis protein CheA n=1 Tax=Novosphingobium sp. TaxID=1874826 RepID=UPI0035B0E783